MIVLKDVATLFENDLEKYVIASVLDPRIITFDNSWGGVLNHEELGLSGKTRYFNTGLILMNTKKWRELNITEKIIDCIDNNKKFANYPDQVWIKCNFSQPMAGVKSSLESLFDDFSQ